jgi:hypothetical protein
MAINELCRLAEVSRTGYYRWKSEAPAAESDMELRDEIQRIALEFTLGDGIGNRAFIIERCP